LWREIVNVSEEATALTLASHFCSVVLTQSSGSQNRDLRYSSGALG
jgi:hypothetical protein